MYTQLKIMNLLIIFSDTASSVLDAWPLTRTIQDNMQVPHTHDRPVCQVLYNTELNQVITVCTESVIKVRFDLQQILIFQCM